MTSAWYRTHMLPKWIRTAAGLSVGAASFLFLIVVLNPIQALSSLLLPISRRAVRAINRGCARTIWGFWSWQAEVMNGIRVRVTGDPIPWRENALLLPNHQSMADVMVLLMFALRAGRLGDLKWFAKDMLKYVPGPGWGMSFLDCVYVKRNWADDEAEIHRLFGKYRRDEIPLFLVTFLEGTRFTPEKHARAAEFAASRGLPVPTHTLVPRTKGFVATITGLCDHLDAVYDLTIAYPPPTPSLVDCFAARVPHVDLHLRRFPIAELPTDPDALAAWAAARFAEKDALLAEHRATGRFPGPVVSGPFENKDFLRAMRPAPEPRRGLPAQARGPA